MRQYNQIKQKYPDAILLFRVGDFYETFGDDACVVGSSGSRPIACKSVMMSDELVDRDR